MYKLILEEEGRILYTGTSEECHQERLRVSLDPRYKNKSLVVKEEGTHIGVFEVLLAFLVVILVLYHEK